MRTYWLLLLLLIASPTYAHKSSDSYLTLSGDAQSLQGQWDIHIRDLDYAIGIDSDQDGRIVWGELREQRAAITAYAYSRLHLSAGDTDCAIEERDLLVDQHSDGSYAVLRFVARCPVQAGTLRVRYGLLFDLDPQHRGLLRLERGDTTHTAIFSPDHAVQSFDTVRVSWMETLLEYSRTGVWHIWIGYDHILFLLSLLLPSVLFRHARQWFGVNGFRSVFVDVVQIVTAFTVAHSITLSLAALGIVDLPSRYVESAIALSVILAALNNLHPLLLGKRWAVAFAFGLVHGLGFANVLTELGLPTDALTLALVGFNVGVELGQLAIVSLFLPIAYNLRHSFFYRRVALGFGSLVIAMLASVWLVERMTDTTLLAALAGN